MIFRLFEDIRIVKGYNRSALLDLSREKILFVPNYFAEELLHLNYESDYKNKLKEKYPDNYREQIQFIEENEIGFECTKTESDFFPKLNTNWKNSSIISNAIIEISKKTKVKWIRSIEELGCKHLEFRVEDANCLQTILSELMDSRIKSIILVFPSQPDKLEELLEMNPRIIETHIFNSEGLKSNLEKSLYFHSELFEDRPITPQNTRHLTVNVNIFTESLLANTYSYRKVFISAIGLIKNTPESIESFANMGDLKDSKELIKFIKSDDFSRASSISKSKIDICSLCEFRNSCVCNRTPQKRENGSWFFKEECAYNPFISKWSYEDDYMNLETIDVQCNAEVFQLNKKRIEEVNTLIWD